MAFLPTRNDVTHLVADLPPWMLQEQPSSEINNSSEAWLTFLRELTDVAEQHVGSIPVENTASTTSNERVGPLQKVAPGPWRSLGGYFDYAQWADRDRFLELDMAIASAQHPYEAIVDPDEFLLTAA